MADQTTGFGTRVQIATTSPSVTATFLETAVTPTGFVGDDPIDQTSNANTKFNSFTNGDLVTKSPTTMTVYYQISKVDEIKSIEQVPGTVTITDKLGNTNVDNGWLQSFEPQEQVKGQRPTATITIAYEGEDASGTDNQVVTIA